MGFSRLARRAARPFGDEVGPRGLANGVDAARGLRPWLWRWARLRRPNLQEWTSVHAPEFLHFAGPGGAEAPLRLISLSGVCQGFVRRS